MPAWHEAAWVDDPDAPRQKKRRSRWTWLWLLLIPALLLALSLARSNNYWQWTDMTFTTLQCQESLPESPSWADMEVAGCAPAAVGATVVLLSGGSAADEEPETDGTDWTFQKVPSAFSTLGVNVIVPQSAGSVTVVNAETDPPQVQPTMNKDVSGVTFSQTLDQGDSSTFYVVIAP